jgi:hypothetical protein
MIQSVPPDHKKHDQQTEGERHAIFFLVRDRWNHPGIKPPDQAEHSTTGTAARNAGAKLVPSEPKLKVEPDPPGPAPVHPANPN